jgi:hypothetical protein
MQSKETARDWLRANGYEETAAVIDEIMAEWKAEGKATRRNWWEVLAGDSRGNPRKIAGRVFPIIRAVRKRQGLPDIEDAQCNAPREVAPKIIPSARWPTRRKRKTRPKAAISGNRGHA